MGDRLDDAVNMDARPNNIGDEEAPASRGAREINPALIRGRAAGVFPMHPTPLGQEEMAKTIAAYL